MATSGSAIKIDPAKLEALNNLKFDDDMKKAMIENYSYFKEIELKEDEYVFHYGEIGDEFFIILEGSVRFLIPIKDKTQATDHKKASVFIHTEVDNSPYILVYFKCEDNLAF